jgi:cell pole-organizing protein PopZ
MSSPAKAHEPSMEEILASIRRIIADDETPTAAAAVAASPGDAAAPAAAASDDVLDLTDPVMPTNKVDVEFGESEAPLPKVDTAPAPEAETATPPPVEPVPLRPQPRPPGGERLLSPAADSAASSAFAALAHTVLAENSRTLEDLVHEMLRPMLKTWLDDNLPALVERLVRQEIERVSRGGRR